VHLTAGTPGFSTDHHPGAEPVSVCHGPGTREPGIGCDRLKLKASADSVRGIWPDFNSNGPPLVGIEAEQVGHLAAGVGSQRHERAVPERAKTPRLNLNVH